MKVFFFWILAIAFSPVVILGAMAAGAIRGACEEVHGVCKEILEIIKSVRDESLS